MTMSNNKIRGIIPYLVSPTDDSGSIKTDVLARLCEDLIAANVNGLAALGSTGEFAYLAWEDRLRVAQTVIDVTRKRVPVLTGVSATTVKEAVRQAQAMQGIGADALNLAMDTYVPVGIDGIIEYYRSVAESVSIPVVIYLNKAFSGASLPMELFETLASVDNIRYIKDATGNTGQLLSILNRVGKKIDVFAASAHVPACVMLLGGSGWMAGPACLVPRSSVELYRRCTEGRWNDALALQTQLWGLNEMFLRYDPAAVVKHGLTFLGYPAGEALCPGSKLSKEVRRDLEKILIDCRHLEESLRKTDQGREEK